MLRHANVVQLSQDSATEEMNHIISSLAVDIREELEDEIHLRRISVEREDGMVEIEFEADGERR